MTKKKNSKKKKSLAKTKPPESERKARLFNALSLFACIIVLLVNYFVFITVFVAVLAILQFVHMLFGDITSSYRMLRKHGFLRLYITMLLICCVLAAFLIIFLEPRGKYYFAALVVAFLADFAANKTRTNNLK